MPSFKDNLTAEQIAALVEAVKALRK
jgi:hypothetical protein